MRIHQKQSKIKCPIILSAFRNNNKAAKRCQFDFSVINLFYEFSQPSIPYFSKEVEYDKIEKVVTLLNNTTDNIDRDMLKHYGRLLWNHLIPREIGHYLADLERSYALHVSLVSNDMQIPWEIIYDDVGYWCLRYSLGRIYGNPNNNSYLRYFKRRKDKFAKPSLLLIYDPEGNLPYAKREGERIKTRLQNIFNVVPLTGKVSAFDIALEMGSDKYSIIHFAGHASMTKNSSLVGFRSYLESKTISGYSLPRHPLVFANACSTGAIRYYGANSRNIAESFIEAGAAAFIGTLWKTNDKLSADFAADFYECLLQGLSIGDALMMTKNNFIKKSKSDDIDWASFCLFGNPDKRLFAVTSKKEFFHHRLQLTMSNDPGTLGRILVEFSKLGVDIVSGRSITFDDKKTAGYIAEIAVDKDVESAKFVQLLRTKVPEKLLKDISFF